jgi:hypothetical protein
MKILNREKTHFMQRNADGTNSVKFGKVSEVHGLIDAILDAEPNKDSKKPLRVVEPDQSVKTK